jgi:hypothetical protein
MKVQEVVRPYKMFTARVYVKQPDYVGTMDVTVTAQNQWIARTLLKGMYGVPDHRITNVRELH